MITEKTCSKCKESKEIDANFYFIAATGCFHSYCNQCRSEYNKKAYRNNPNASLVRVRKHRENTKLMLKKSQNVNMDQNLC